MSSTQDSKSKYTSNVSTEAAVELSDFVESLELENGVYHTSPESINDMVKFLSKQFNIISLVQIQSFCATKNDHSSLTSLNENLKMLIQFANITPDLHNLVKPLITELISSHNIKVFYRCFSNEHPSITIPAINLLTEIVAFENGSFIDQFLENFDLSLKSLKDLFYPTKTSAKLSSIGKSNTTVRHFMSIFWITLCSNASPLTRSDLLSNYKPINFTWIKFTTEFDNADLIKKVINFFDEKILMEPAYRKMTKCKLIGDNTISKFVDLYNFEDVTTEIDQLLTKITTDEINGLLFHDFRTWFNNVPLNLLPSNSTFNNSGVPIFIGEEKFKINNKLIYKILTLLKPWSNSLHLKLVINILTKASELCAPYTTYLFHINGAHDPKMTSFYIGQTLTLTKITQLSIPKEFVTIMKKYMLDNDYNNETLNITKTNSYLSDKILMDVICPPQLNRSVLTEGLRSPNQMIRHLTIQLVISVIQKFSKVYKLLTFNENSLFSALRNEIKDLLINVKLPDSSAIVGATNECLKENKINKLLILNYIKAADCYYNILDINVSLQIGSFDNLIGIKNNESKKADKINTNEFISESKMSDIDLLLFNYYLTLTANSSISNQQNKWWNIAKGSKNTLFTTIAKLPYNLQFKEENGDNIIIDNALITKVVEVLSNFLNDSLAFESFKSSKTKILNSQSWAIVLSMLNIFNSLTENKQEIIESICKILDESISRSIRTPYKYYDIVTSSSNKLNLKNERVSAFFVALCEQSKFANVEYDSYINEWIKLTSIYMFLLGESSIIMKSIIKEYRNIDFNTNFQNFELYINTHNGNNYRLSDFSNICFMPLKELKSKVNSMVFKSDMDIIGVIDRIRSLIECDIEFKDIKDVLFDLLSVVGNYVIQKYSGVIDNDISVNNVELLDEKYWINLFISKEDAENKNGNNQIVLKKIFVMDLLNDVFKTLWTYQIDINFKKSLREYIYKFINNKKLSDISIRKISDYLWVLTDNQISNLIVNKEFNYFTNKLIEIGISRSLKFDNNDIFKFAVKIIKSDNNIDFCENIPQLMNDSTYTNDQILELISLIQKCNNNNNNKNLIYKIIENICTLDSNKIKLVNDVIETEFNELTKSIEGFKFLQFLSESKIEFKSKLFEKSMKYINLILKNDIQADLSMNIYLHSILLFVNENKGFEKENVEKSIKELILLDSIRNVANLIFSPEMTELIFKLFKDKDDNIIINWLNRATLYITKVFAENETYYLNEDFKGFLQKLQESLPISIWKYVSKNMINSQLEVILSKEWVNNIKVLKYTTWIIMTGSKNVIESNKLVNIYLNNSRNCLIKNEMNNEIESEEIRYYSSIILSYLIKFNLKQFSTIDIIFKVIKFYKGTTLPSDLILKDLFEVIEEENRESWVQFVSNWDLIDEWNNENNNEIPQFIIETPGLHDCLTINLNKRIIENSIKNFNCNKRNIRIPKLGNKIETQREDFSLIEDFFDIKKIDYIENNFKIQYDIEFLLLLIINNEELFKISEDSINVNIKLLIDNNLLQLIVCGLAHEVKEIKEISKRIISSIIINIEEDIKNIEKQRINRENKTNTNIDNEHSKISISTFKERNIFKVYLCNLLFTIEDIEKEDNKVVSKLFILTLSNLIPILSNPLHFLFEKAYRYILGGSKYREFEIPMYKSIMNNFIKDEHLRIENDDEDRNEDNQNYYKQLQWMLNTLIESITNKEDLKILRRNEVIEQLLNLINSPFLSYGLQENIIKIFERINRLENGSDLLIRSFGIIGFIENKKITRNNNNKILDKYIKLLLKSVVGSECNGKDKRSINWCNEDYDNIVKRVCM